MISVDTSSPLRCPYCGMPATLVWVHGHGQCARCGTNVDECCRGECHPHTPPAESIPLGNGEPEEPASEE